MTGKTSLVIAALFTMPFVAAAGEVVVYQDDFSGRAEPDFWPRYYQALRLEILIEDGSWKEVANLSTAGHGAKGTFEPAVASRVRLHVKRHNGWAGIAELFLFRPE